MRSEGQQRTAPPNRHPPPAMHSRCVIAVGCCAHVRMVLRQLYTSTGRRSVFYCDGSGLKWFTQNPSACRTPARHQHSPRTARNAHTRRTDTLNAHAHTRPKAAGCQHTNGTLLISTAEPGVVHIFGRPICFNLASVDAHGWYGTSAMATIQLSGVMHAYQMQ
jgi:hypothetical protein